MGGELLSLPCGQDVLLAKVGGAGTAPGRGLSPRAGKQSMTMSPATDVQAAEDPAFQHNVLQPKGLLQLFWGTGSEC